MARSRTSPRRPPSPTRVLGKVRPHAVPNPGADPFADPVIVQLTGEIRQHHAAANRQSVEARAENGRRLLEVK
ncbi:MAG: hypothetical protein RIF41_21170, partial [Polyangiaceae bacterium]